MQGAGKHRTWSVPVNEAGVCLWSDEPPDVERRALVGVLATERSEAWTGVTVQRGEAYADQNLWLSTISDLCWLKASQDTVGRGLVAPA